MFPLILDIIFIIFGHLDFRSQTRLAQTCKTCLQVWRKLGKQTQKKQLELHQRSRNILVKTLFGMDEFICVRLGFREDDKFEQLEDITESQYYFTYDWSQVCIVYGNTTIFINGRESCDSSEDSDGYYEENITWEMKIRICNKGEPDLLITTSIYSWCTNPSYPIVKSIEEKVMVEKAMNTIKFVTSKLYRKESSIPQYIKKTLRACADVTIMKPRKWPSR